MFDRESSIMGSPYFGNRCHREITDWEAFHVPLLILSVRRRIFRRLVCHAFLIGQVDVFRPAVGLSIGDRGRRDLLAGSFFERSSRSQASLCTSRFSGIIDLLEARGFLHKNLPAAGFFAAGFVSAVTALFTASSGTLAAAL